MTSENNAPDNENTPPNVAIPVDSWLTNFLEDYLAKKSTTQAHGVAGLKAAIPFLAHIGVTNITMTYQGSGDQGDIEDIVITSKQNGPKTCDEIDAALKKFPPETQAYERFRIDELKERVFEVLPPGFEINEGSYGEVRIDCVTGKIQRDNNERIVEIHSSEDEW